VGHLAYSGDVEWKDIADAPRERDFIVLLGNGYVTRGRYIGGKAFACDSHGPCRSGDDTEPKAWIDLPTISIGVKH